MKSPYKCPAHNFWMRKGQCELCRVEADKRQREYEKTGGSCKPPVVIGTTDKLKGRNAD